jgi:hypothetical protein
MAFFRLDSLPRPATVHQALPPCTACLSMEVFVFLDCSPYLKFHFVDLYLAILLHFFFFAIYVINVYIG